MDSQAAVVTNGLTRQFGEIVAVDHLTVEIPSDAVVGFVGPNGAGKSTTLRMLLGLIAPSSGGAAVLGQSIEHPVTYCDAVGALVESPAFVPNITGRANLQSMAHLRGLPATRVGEVLEVVGLTGAARRKVSTYSLGMKQRLGIAVALLSDPQLLVLDEPTNGLDPAGVVEIRALIRRLAGEGRTVIVSSHLLSEIEAAADHLIVIRSGRLLYAGPLEGLLEQEKRYVEVAASDPGDFRALEQALTGAGYDIEAASGGLRVMADPDHSGTLTSLAMDAGVVLSRLVPRSETLEDIFLRMTADDLAGDRP